MCTNTVVEAGVTVVDQRLSILIRDELNKLINCEVSLGWFIQSCKGFRWPILGQTAGSAETRGVPALGTAKTPGNPERQSSRSRRGLLPQNHLPSPPRGQEAQEFIVYTSERWGGGGRAGKGSGTPLLARGLATGLSIIP